MPVNSGTQMTEDPGKLKDAIHQSPGYRQRECNATATGKQLAVHSKGKALASSDAAIPLLDARPWETEVNGHPRTYTNVCSVFDWNARHGEPTQTPMNRGRDQETGVPAQGRGGGVGSHSQRTAPWAPRSQDSKRPGCVHMTELVHCNFALDVTILVLCFRVTPSLSRWFSGR